MGKLKSKVELMELKPLYSTTEYYRTTTVRSSFCALVFVVHEGVDCDGPW